MYVHSLYIFKKYTRPKLKSQVFPQIDLRNDATPSPNPLRRETSQVCQMARRRLQLTRIFPKVL